MSITDFESEVEDESDPSSKAAFNIVIDLAIYHVDEETSPIEDSDVPADEDEYENENKNQTESQIQP